MQEVEKYMHEFRDHKLPIDSFIMDYDWFGPGRVPPRQPDCAASPNNTTAQGNYSCGDYGCRCGWWNEQKFKQSNGSVVSTKTAADLF